MDTIFKKLAKPMVKETKKAIVEELTEDTKTEVLTTTEKETTMRVDKDILLGVCVIVSILCVARMLKRPTPMVYVVKV